MRGRQGNFRTEGEETVKERMVAAAAILVLALAGCTGPGENIKFSASAAAVSAPEKAQNALRVAVVTFEDLRPDKASVGRHQHYVETWVDTLVPEPGPAAEQVTAFVADYLTRAGFQVTRVPSSAAAGSVDVVLTGQIESYWNEAVGRFFRTELTSRNRLVLRASNASDSSSVRASVAGDATRKVFCFCLTDLEELNSDALAQSLGRFLGEVAVSDRGLKPRR